MKDNTTTIMIDGHILMPPDLIKRMPKKEGDIIRVTIEGETFDFLLVPGQCAYMADHIKLREAENA